VRKEKKRRLMIEGAKEKERRRRVRARYSLPSLRNPTGGLLGKKRTMLCRRRGGELETKLGPNGGGRGHTRQRVDHNRLMGRQPGRTPVWGKKEVITEKKKGRVFKMKRPKEEKERRNGKSPLA